MAVLAAAMVTQEQAVEIRVMARRGVAIRESRESWAVCGIRCGATSRTRSNAISGATGEGPQRHRQPDHEEHDNMLIWVGGAFDSKGFDINSANLSYAAVA